MCSPVLFKSRLLTTRADSERSQLRLAPRGLLVHVEDSGVWALDADADAKALVGKRVKVEGTRTGFDRIDVEWIVAA